MNMKRKDREITDRADICHIIDQAKIMHLGLIDGDYPYIVPLHYGFEYLDREDTFIFYMHGAKNGHKIDLIHESSNAFVEIETDIALVSGGDVPCGYGSFYSSFMGRGQVTIVEDSCEKKHGLHLLMKNQTHRRFDFTEQMLSTVAVLKVTVKDYTAKAKKH